MNTIQTFIGNADAFPVLRHWDFFNHAGVSPLPAVAAAAMRQFADEAARGAYLDTTWYADLDQLRSRAAGLINATPAEIAFVKNTSEGISIVAGGIDWQWGDRIVTTAVEYPANIYPWMEVSRGRGTKLVMVPEEARPDGSRWVPMDKILLAAAEPRTRLLTLSHVEFASGQRHDLETLGRFCRERGILFCVDGIQTLGAFPVDVKRMNIDFLSADGHKWMLGPEGAGLFYCRQDLIERTRPVMVGWMNVINAQDYGNYDYILRPDAGRFECGSHNLAGLLGLKASLDLITEVGLEAISTRLHLLSNHLAQGLTAKGYQILSPRQSMLASGIISFASPVHSHESIVRNLRKEKKIEIALREGRLRASPHFYNTEAQLDRLVEALPGH